MMRVLFLALVAVCASAQTITFAPQPFSRIPGLQEYRVYVSTPAGQPIQMQVVQGMQVVLEALHQNIRLYNYVNLQAYVADHNKRDWLRWVGIGMEVAGWVGTSATAGKIAFIKERWITAGMPMISGGLTLARTYYDREYEPVKVPSDLMPPLIAVPAGQAVDFAVFAP